MQQTVKERINEFIKFKKISSRGFESRCGLSNGYLRQLRNSPTVDKMEMILSAFPEINREWLVSGEGDMLIRDTFNTTTGEVSGSGNMIGSPINQIIGENTGQSAGRDIHNYAEKRLLSELEAQRQLTEKQLEVYASSLEKKDEQIRTAQYQIDTLIKQNQEQFNRFMSLLETMQKV